MEPDMDGNAEDLAQLLASVPELKLAEESAAQLRRLLPIWGPPKPDG